MKQLGLMILLVLCASFTFAININNLSSVASSEYLISDMFGAEAISVESYSRVNCDGIYWVLPINNTQEYIFLSDSEPDTQVDKQRTKDLIITVNFFNSLGDVYYNSPMMNYFELLGRDLEDYAYNLSLIESYVINDEFGQESESVRDDIDKLVLNCVGLVESIDEIRELLSNGETSCSAKDSIVKKTDGIESDLDSFGEDIRDLTKNIDWLRAKLPDLNLSYDDQVGMANTLGLPDSLANFLKQKNYLDLSKEEVDKANSTKNQFQISLVVDAWEQKKSRADFLGAYLGENEEISDKTRKETPDELYDYVLVNMNYWEDESKSSNFNKEYDEFLVFLNNDEFLNAKNKLDLLTKLAIEVNAGGKKEVNTDPTSDEQKTDYSIYIYIISGLVLLIIVLKVVSYLRAKYKKSEDDNDPEINIELPL